MTIIDSTQLHALIRAVEGTENALTSPKNVCIIIFIMIQTTKKGGISVQEMRIGVDFRPHTGFSAAKLGNYSWTVTISSMLAT